MKLLPTVVFVAAGLLAGSAARAEALDPRAQSMKEQLNLTDKQTQDLDKLFKETRAKQKALRKELQDLRKNQKERMDAILTAEQKKKYEELENEPPPAMGPEITEPMGAEPAQPMSPEPPKPPTK